MLINFTSCTKEDDNLNVDLTKYNSDITVDNDIDKYLSSTFVDPYNIEVVYRYERNFTDVNRDISPVAYEKVEPMMNAVLKTFLKTYEEVAGKAFIKQYTPKQFVLYGSPSYNDNGSITLGTADNGRRIVLYELNSLDFTNPNQVKRPIHTIHHEFTHILNQNIVIPPSFEQISKANYTADWTGAANTATVAKNLGFITQYARSSFGEDFAEMTSFLLVSGQVAFENYCSTTNATAAASLRAKEQLVISYFKDFYNIDFKVLQSAVQKSLKDNYNAVEPVDISNSLANKLINNKVSTIRYTVNADYLTTHGSPAPFRNIVANIQTSFRASGFPEGIIDYVEFRFTDASNVVVRFGFRTSATSGNFIADFFFGMNINPTTSEVLFTKTTVGGVHFGTNGQIFNAGFEANLLTYLTNRIFIADWLPTTIPSTSNLFRTFGGFSVKGAPTNFVYGPIVLK